MPTHRAGCYHLLATGDMQASTICTQSGVNAIAEQYARLKHHALVRCASVMLGLATGT
jgi:hypothetical protein